MSMKVLLGKAVFGGIAFGKLYLYRKNYDKVGKYSIENVDAEIQKFQKAKEKTLTQLQELYDKAIREVGKQDAMIFDIHKMMIEDIDYCESIINTIKNQKVNAEYAVSYTGEVFCKIFSDMQDKYMKERAADVMDVSKKLLSSLLNSDSSNELSYLKQKVIIASDDLAPSETIQLDRNKVLGFITKNGSSNSHTAILARNMNIPAVIGVKEILDPSLHDKNIILDGFSGKVYVEPDENTILKFKEKQRLAIKKSILLEQLKGKENITLDKQKIEIYANISNNLDLSSVMKNDAGGIGLFRSEFLYLGRNNYPSEEEQFLVYKEVAEKMHGKKVIIRTLDIGADKKVDYFNMPKEENPAMGSRAIRICLKRPDIFKTQLRALLRASYYGNIAIMFPMIISLSEVTKIKKLLKEAQSELDNENLPYAKNIELGIMIETPASALISDQLAKEVDFFSIGTNDLVQYTLAIDRQNNDLSDYAESSHKAVLRLIKMATDNAHKNGIWIGICGEMAANTELTETFLAIGIDELSVSPPNILKLREKVRNTNVSNVKNEIIKSIW